jgi:NAD(P)-dependent dehydrogenase (short-subunit alcohol dehydrogenase family)
MTSLQDWNFDFSGQTIIVTGGAGVLCGEIACSLAECGANVAILDRAPENAQRFEERINRSGGSSILLHCDVLNRESIETAFEEVLNRFGSVDGLINGAGGNHPEATTSVERTFADLPTDALRFVFDLNIIGTFLPSQTAAKEMAKAGKGTILNISSMNAFRPLTRIPAYSAAKAGVSNFTQWLAVHMAMEYSPEIRVNAIAPGFFLTDQNRFLLTDRESGELTARGQSIIQHTPLQRFGTPEDLIGAVLWLMSPLSKFVTGVIVPIDGGFQAFSGV